VPQLTSLVPVSGNPSIELSGSVDGDLSLGMEADGAVCTNDLKASFRPFTFYRLASHDCVVICLLCLQSKPACSDPSLAAAANGLPLLHSWARPRNASSQKKRGNKEERDGEQRVPRQGCTCVWRSWCVDLEAARVQQGRTRIGIAWAGMGWGAVLASSRGRG
jgi:hypothetical protein